MDQEFALVPPLNSNMNRVHWLTVSVARKSQAGGGVLVSNKTRNATQERSELDQLRCIKRQIRTSRPAGASGIMCAIAGR